MLQGKLLEGGRAREYAIAFMIAGLVACSGERRDVGVWDDGLSDGGAEDGTDGSGPGSGGSGQGGGSGGDEGSGGDAPGDGDDGIRFDVGSGMNDDGGGDMPCNTDDPDCKCTIPMHQPCDTGTNDPFRAMGLNCPGELQVQTSITGSPQAIGIRNKFGPTNTFNPREGSVYAVIGSGFVNELDSPNGGGFFGDDFPRYCSKDLDGKSSNTELGPLDPDRTLPPPINPRAVGTQDCTQNPALVGTGDCSNTLQRQWDQGASARDYTELRFTVQVPPDVVSFSFDFAFFTTEWPAYHGSQYNDLFIGWLESQKWTGNITFDEQSNPISLNAAFFEFKSQGGMLAPELDGTCMNRHGGTKWLTTTVGVTPGETITVVFAVFDLSDSILDSYVFLDNFRWGCDPSLRPRTNPQG